MATADKPQARRERHNLAHLGNAEVEGVVEMGRQRMKLREVRDLRVGKVVMADKLAGEAFTLRLNGQPFAEGEVVVVPNSMCLRLTRLFEVNQEVAP